MSIYYFCKGGSTVIAYHIDADLVDRSMYGANTYIIVDKTNTAPATDPITGMPTYPTITAAMQSDSTKNECQYRITQKVPNSAQININAYISSINSAFSGGTPPTSQQVADQAMATAINTWIGKVSGMLHAQDALIAANDQQWYLDVKWPTWDPSAAGWSTFVARFI